MPILKHLNIMINAYKVKLTFDMLNNFTKNHLFDCLMSLSKSNDGQGSPPCQFGNPGIYCNGLSNNMVLKSSLMCDIFQNVYFDCLLPFKAKYLTR